MSTTKRVPGGSASKMKDGRWRAYIELQPDSDGDRQRRYFYGKTKKEALAKKQEALIKQGEGISIAPNSSTLGQYLQRWLEQQAAIGKIAPSTLEKYREDIGNHVIPAIGYVKFTDLTEQPIQTMLNNLKHKLADRSLRNVRAALRKALNTPEAKRYHPTNPATLVEMPKSTKPAFKRVSLTPEVANIILDALRGHRTELMARLMMTLGLRLGETMALQKADFSADYSVLTVSGSLRRHNHQLQRGNTKTEAAKAALHVPSTLRAMIRRHIAAENAAQQAQPLLFSTEHGTPIEPHNVLRYFRAQMVRVGLYVVDKVDRHGEPYQTSAIRLQDLRRFCGTQLARGVGADVKTSQSVLRHTRASTTLDYYVDMLPEEQRSALESLDTLLGEDRILELPDKAERKQTNGG